MITKAQLPPCPVATVVQLIGSKWKLLILRGLFLISPEMRFGELRQSLPGISHKVLTEDLRALERDGIVVRTVGDEVPPRVVYALSDLGKSLKPLFDSMQAWGEKYKLSMKEPGKADSAENSVR